jgi:ABC-2 type transport system permease protein
MNISSSSAVSAFPAPRVMPNALHAFGGIFRLTARRFFTPGHWLTLGGMLAVLALFAYAGRHSDQRYLVWCGLFYVCFLVPILAFISSAGLMRDDLKAGTVDYIFTRPVRRSAFIAFRYLSHVGCAQIDFLIALFVLMGMGIFRGVPGLWEAFPVLLLGQAVVIVTFSAFGFLCGIVTSRYVIIGLLYGGIVEVGVGSVPTQLNRISMLRHVTEVLKPVLGNAKLGMGGPLAAEPLSAPTAFALLLAIAAGMLALTAAFFAMRELAGQSGRDA